MKHQIKYVYLANSLFTIGFMIQLLFVFYFSDQFNLNEQQIGYILSAMVIFNLTGTLSYSKFAQKMKVVNHYVLASCISGVAYIIAGLFSQEIIVFSLGIFVTCISSTQIMLLRRKIISQIVAKNDLRQAFANNFMLVNIGCILSALSFITIYQINFNYFNYCLIIAGFMMLSSGIIIYLRFNSHHFASDSLSIEVSKNNKMNYNYYFLLGGFASYFLLFQLQLLIPTAIETHFSMLSYIQFLVINFSFSIVLSPFIAEIMKKVSDTRCFQLSGVIIMVSLMLIIYGNHNLLMLGSLVFTFGEVIMLTMIDAYIAKHYQGHQFDTMQVTYRLVVQAAKMLSPIIIGSLIVGGSFAPSMLVLMFVTIIAYLAFGKVKLTKVTGITNIN